MSVSSDYEVTKVNLSDFKKIYLSDIFAQARDDVWHTNEKKLALLFILGNPYFCLQYNFLYFKNHILITITVKYALISVC